MAYLNSKIKQKNLIKTPLWLKNLDQQPKKVESLYCVLQHLSWITIFIPYLEQLPDDIATHL